MKTSPAPAQRRGSCRVCGAGSSVNVGDPMPSHQAYGGDRSMCPGSGQPTV